MTFNQPLLIPPVEDSALRAQHIDPLSLQRGGHHRHLAQRDQRGSHDLLLSGSLLHIVHVYWQSRCHGPHSPSDHLGSQLALTTKMAPRCETINYRLCVAQAASLINVLPFIFLLKCFEARVRIVGESVPTNECQNKRSRVSVELCGSLVA